MARRQALKVFRTAIGFHDAYVAAPSQKAALKAWGADANLFAAGLAERVEDPELMREPLANPGTVVRRLRGTLAEHIAALPKDEVRPAKRPPKPSAEIPPAAPPTAKARAPKPAPPPKPRPRPDRAPLDKAEAELADLAHRHAAAKAAFARRLAELERERQALEVQQARERDKIERRVATARDRYESKMSAWRAS